MKPYEVEKFLRELAEGLQNIRYYDPDWREKYEQTLKRGVSHLTTARQVLDLERVV